MIVRSVIVIVLLLGQACAGKGEGGSGEAGTADSSRPAVQPSSNRPDSRPAIVFLGTSLTAGYGLGDPALGLSAR